MVMGIERIEDAANSVPNRYPKNPRISGIPPLSQMKTRNCLHG